MLHPLATRSIYTNYDMVGVLVEVINYSMFSAIQPLDCVCILHFQFSTCNMFEKLNRFGKLSCLVLYT